MREQSNGVQITAAAVSDRGLSEKRPLNEDSYLADAQRHIFAVADGVGGAQAGEVASKTAMEVLDEAFRHQVDGTDVEDLMEIAIQRANNSIYQMAQDHPKLSAMATTIVALHLDGHIATIGHVGDSRLYRLNPDGQLYRETDDHSVVEEEVRAGRMTPEQAAHHPSRNVISRALGAEAGVEVDMKTIEVEDGTTFLLCSDGITRHIPDDEIRELLIQMPNLDEACAEMKRRCYERGAEDNLTAVVVRLGERLGMNLVSDIGEHTIQSPRPLPPTVDSTLNVAPAAIPPQPEPSRLTVPTPTGSPTPPSSLPPPPVSENALSRNPVLALEEQAKARRKGGGGGRAFLLLLLILGIGAGAFFGGIYFQRQRASDTAQTTPTAQPTPQATPADTVAEFEKKRAEVDTAPAQKMKSLRDELSGNGAQDAMASTDPEKLYLYGRALLLMGDNQDALPVFERVISLLKESAPSPDRASLYEKLKVESRLAALATVHRLRYKNLKPNADAERKVVQAFDELIDQLTNKGVSQVDPSQ